MKLLLLALGLAAGTVQSPPPASERDAIVVTGQRLDDARRALEACLARGCPPLDDVAASLRYAEAQFIHGDYEQADRTLRQAIGRNGDQARRYPVAVAGLYRAHSRISIHQGNGEAYRRATFAATRALRAGLDDDDPRILAQQLEAAGMHVSLREVRSAEYLYRSVASRARAIGRPDIAALADTRRGWLYHILERSDGRAVIEQVAQSTDPRSRVQRYAARILLARIGRAAGNLASSDRLIGELATAGFGAPVLVYAPPIELDPLGGPGANSQGGSVNVANMAASGDFGAWADVGYWVNADGRVEDVEMLRSNGRTGWLAPVLRSIGERVYAPAGTAQAEPTYRIERFTYTSLGERRTGSRITARGAQARIESIDLTGDPAAAARPAGPTP